MSVNSEQKDIETNSEDQNPVQVEERSLTLTQAMKTSQFWLIYIMASLSVTQGYYTVTVFKQFG